ncbi:MAG: P-type conjugative transfer protein TrbG [Synergistaceae bacterium]|nr:P-type conjugative transfer protein TrbG [Synergistaceae bacterium]
MNLMNKKFYLALAVCTAFFFVTPAGIAECSALWESVSGDFREAVLESGKEEMATEPVSADETAEMVEIEYDGKMISVDIRDLILMADGEGGQKVDLGDPSRYGKQLETAPLYGVRKEEPGEYQNVSYEEDEYYAEPEAPSNLGISEREYEEEQRARRWAEVFEDLSLREIDDKALELVREFGEAKDAVPPITGVAGSVVITWSSYTPKIVCRPMYVTDIILQPGESVTGVHPGDPVRWSFVPSVSGSGENAQTHVMIKPLASDISTNVIINTDRRTYQLDLISSAKDFMPSVSFSYPGDSIKAWDVFMTEKKKERESSVALSSGYSIDPENLHLAYEIRGRDSLRWKPIRVWDDGVKTYIQFKKGSTRKSVEAPVLVVYEHKKEVLVNYRAARDIYIVDRVFDKAALIVGTGSTQYRVVITRLNAE